MTYRTVRRFGLAAMAFCCALVGQRAEAQTAISPYFLVVVDNSGSMGSNTGCSVNNGTSQATCQAQTGCSWFATGSRCVATTCFALTSMATCNAVAGCAWNGTNSQCRGDGLNSCGQTHTRINDARCVMQQVVNAYGDVTFGLMRYNETVTDTTCSGTPGLAYTDCSTCNNDGSGCPGTGAAASQGQLLAPIVARGGASVVRWADFACAGGWDSGTNPELRADTFTPIAGTVLGAKSYFEGTGLFSTVNGAARPGSPITSSATDTCRPVSLIFLTDGEETCASDLATTNAIDALWSSTVGGVSRHIPSYWIGFGVTPGNAYIESFATHGHTDAPGPNAGFYATDETSLALAFSQIIADSILVERCDGADNDCDTRVDEGFTLYCNRNSAGMVTATGLCTPPAETCDGVDNNCDGVTDEGVLNACGNCLPVPMEVCNGADDNCNGFVDEGNVCMGCVPSAEICNNRDDDCDGTIDNITRPCGIMLGRCTTGVERCTAGVWGTCSGLGPVAETCNNIDDDCDGMIDGQVQSCGSNIGACRPGSQICTAGVPGACIGAIGPTTEVCDGIDNNCNGSTDEGDPGSGGSCGSGIGVCTRGTYHCVGGMLTCTGGSSGSSEVCNNLDDDCDGSIDEGITSMGACAGGSSVGVCNPGQMLCTGGSYMCVGRVDPSPEICDGLDNNCNGSTDEGNPEGGAMCGDDTGACMSGTTQCMGGVLSCVGAVGPTPEVCNAIDDDCNGVVDDGIPVGAPCGSSMGECTPGVFVCDPSTGMLVCQGGISGIDELCDTLDNDCDGAVDEGVGAGVACGVDVGECTAGITQCVGGAIMCVGATSPTTEVCDCNDNDCNGMVDEPPTGGSLCPSGSACVMCQCASACVHGEFGDRCPDGTTPFNHDGICSCVAPACDATTCAGETHTDTSGTVLCEPSSADGTVGACVCRNNACTFACEGVTCMGALVCNPHDGTCVENSCRALGCPAGEICNPTSGGCEADPCAAVTCGTDQACRSGTCENTCAGVTCATGQRCHAGACVTDECAGVTCTGGRVCNPADGSCVVDMCISVTCPATETCNPVTGTCEGDPCLGLHCPTGTTCDTGECVTATMPGTDSGVPTDAGRPMVDAATVDAGTTTVDDHHRVLASGGGCLCAAAGRSSGRGDAAGMTLGLLALAGVLVRARRRQVQGGVR